MREIRTEVVIDATPERVWDVLFDAARYDAWNPFIREMSGTFSEGHRFRANLIPAGRKPVTFQPTVTDVQPHRRLEWLGKVAVRGIFDGRHVFELHAEDERTRLVHREEFSGLFAPFLLRMIGDATEAGFEAMNEALKATVEGRVAT